MTDEENYLYNLADSEILQNVKVTVSEVENGLLFNLPELEVLSIQDLNTRLEMAFPEYKFEFVNK